MRFPGFHKKWETKKLGEIGEIVNGLTYNPNDINENGVLVLRSSNVQNRTITLEDNVYVNSNSFNPVKENDILICVRNGSRNLIGKNALIKKEHEGLAFGAFMSIYRSQHNKFLFQWFDTVQYKEIVNKNLGATINSINGSDLKKFEVPFPEIEEQNKIAQFLSLIDDRIQTQNKIIENLESQIKSLQEKIFKREQKFRNSNGESYSDWQPKKLGEIGQTFNGLTGKTKEDFGAGKSFIQYKQIFDSSKIQIEGCGYVNVLVNEAQNTVKFGDVFFTVSSETPNEIGMSSVLLNEVNELYLNSFCFGYRPNSLNIINPKYARYYFRSKVFRGKITKLAQGSTRYNMSKTELMKLEIQLPSLDEQIRISESLEAIDDKIQIENDVLKKYMLQKKYLLKNLFI